MAELKERLRNDLTASIKGRERLRASTLRMVLAALTNAEVAGKAARELSDDEVLAVIAAEAKKRRESAEAFAAGGRHELADKETAEATLLADYLPEQMSTEAIAAVVADVVEQTGTAGQGMKAMGTVMAAVQPRVKGRADGGAVALEVRRQLGT